MTFPSILFQQSEDRARAEAAQPPVFFVDLNLDQIINAVTIGKTEYNLAPLFYTPLGEIDAIHFRHEVMQDLQDLALYEHIKSFSQAMRTMRESLVQADKRYYRLQKESWFLNAVEIYCDAVNDLALHLGATHLKSRGFLGVHEYLNDYVRSDPFTALLAETKKLKSDLASVRYCVLIKDSGFKVRKYESESDYSADVEATFGKFKRGLVKNYSVKFTDLPDMNHIEAKALDFVAQLYPDLFSQLDNYTQKNADYLDKVIAAFDREIQFYVSYLDYISILQSAGLRFCYPTISDQSKEISVDQGFDLALAYQLVGQGASVVCNDFWLKGNERILVVSGPNQGGKTTFARAFGQLHFLAALGCPVPGRASQLFLSDRLFTHFEKEEDMKNMRGKLADDLVRIHGILDQATERSIVIMNESFNSTTLKDAIFLGKRVLERIVELDLLCVCVTFIEELASFSEKSVSMVSTVVRENPALRTYKIVRHRADGLAYAISIAEKYGLTYDCLRERIRS
jgi:DNA mismatch repair protein MutS